MPKPLTATVTLAQDHITEAIAEYLKAQGFAVQSVFLEHTDINGGRDILYSAKAYCEPKPPKPPGPVYRASGDTI